MNSDQNERSYFASSFQVGKQPPEPAEENTQAEEFKSIVGDTSRWAEFGAGQKDAERLKQIIMELILKLCTKVLFLIEAVERKVLKIYHFKKLPLDRIAQLTQVTPNPA